jgi:GT2 family glycosyltransferase
MKLSVIIPSYRDPLLIKTIDSLLATSALGDRLEIIAVLDGYWPSFELREDPRVRYIHLGKNRGMRGAINAGVQAARGEFLLRSDEHCLFAQGFDKAMVDVCQPNWIITARRYFLDPKRWAVMDLPYIDYEKLIIQKPPPPHSDKFSGQPWHSRDKRRAHLQIDETMAMQGSCWVMPRQWWKDVIGELQTEGYGPLTQDSHEMVFKTWQAGGRLMLNKNTWFAHKHRSFPRTHNSGTRINPANTQASGLYCLKVWGEYYENEVKPKWGI